MKKYIFTALIAVFLILGGGVYYFSTNINSIIKGALEKYGSQITQTDVNIRDVNIALRTGEGTISGVRIGNPKSYIAARAMDIGQVSMKIDTKSLTGAQPIIIEKIEVDGPSITYEVNATGGSNLQQLRHNVSSKSTKPKSGDNPARKVVIKDLYIRDGKVTVTHSLLRGREATTNLPLIHLRNIGQGGGASPEYIAEKILMEITRQASNVGARTLRNEFQNELPSLNNIDNGLSGGAADTINSVGKLFGQ